MIYNDNFSMRALAEKAEVSVVTAYSLFGSRQNIIATLFEQDLVTFDALLSKQGADVIDRMFAALRLAADSFGEDPSFYRLMFRAIYASGDTALNESFITPRIRSWELLVEQAIAEGFLDADLNVNAMAKNIIHMLIGSIQDWTRENITLDQMHAEVGFGLSLILIPVASRKIVPRLKARYRADDAVLRELAASPA